jgi:hypothetical protein
MTNPTDLRAGNADRERVIETLQQAYADGRLTDHELAHRIEATQSARTFGDLDAVVADLPILRPSIEAAGRFTSVPAPGQVPAVPRGASPENPLVIEAGWSSAKRDGAWEIPQFVRLVGGLGTVTLDCTEAHATESVIHLWVEGDLGTITVIVPQGWAADADGLRKSMGTMSVKVPKEPTMGRPILVVHGTLGMGTFTVRNPNWFERRRLEKTLR